MRREVPCNLDPSCGLHHEERDYLIMSPCPAHLKDHAQYYIDLVAKIRSRELDACVTLSGWPDAESLCAALRRYLLGSDEGLD